MAGLEPIPRAGRIRGIDPVHRDPRLRAGRAAKCRPVPPAIQRKTGTVTNYIFLRVIHSMGRWEKETGARLNCPAVSFFGFWVIVCHGFSDGFSVHQTVPN